MSELPVTPFWNRFQGVFYSLLKWQDMDMLWDRLKSSPEGWYVFDMQEKPPQRPAEDVELITFLAETADFLRKRRRQDYCGCIYVDSRDNPEFIKIFDPLNMGTACGCSKARILPRWTLTRIKPDASLPAEPPSARKAGLFSRLFDRVSVS